MGTLFLSIYKLVNKNKIFAIVLLFIMLGVSGFYISKLKFVEDITKVLPESETIDQMNFVFNNSKFMDKVVFNISINDTTAEPNPDELIKFTKTFTDSLNVKFDSTCIESIRTEVDQQAMMTIYDTLYNNLPLFLNDNDYARLDTILQPENIRKTVASNFKSIISPAGMITRKMVQKDPFSISFMVLNKFKGFQVNNNFELYNNFIISKDKRNLIFFLLPAQPKNSAVNNKLFTEVDNLINRLNKTKFKNIKVEYFGSAVVAVGNSNRIKLDIIYTVGITLFVLIFLVTWFFHRLLSFVFVMIPVVLGAIVSLAFIYIIKGEVSAISLGIGSVLLGVSVDYSLHIFSHLRDNSTIENTIKELSTPIIISSFTTVSAFLTLFFVNSEALHDLGLFAAISVFSASVFTLTILPHLIKVGTKQSKKNTTILDNIAKVELHKYKLIIYGIIILSIIFLFFSKNVGFNANMMENNYMSEKVKKAEANINKLTSIANRTVFFVSSGKTFDDALYNNEMLFNKLDSLKEAGIIANSVSINTLAKPKAVQLQAIKKWKQFWSTRADTTKKYLIEYGKQFGFKETTYNKFYDLINKNFEPLNFENFTAFNELFLNDYSIKTDTAKYFINIVKFNDDKNVNNVEALFSNSDKIWTIDKQNITNKLVQILKDNFNKLMTFSLLIVFLILLIAFGRIELTIITMLPILISWLWITGIMGIFNLHFNIVNIIIVTFVFGLGVDYSVFIMNGLLYKYKYGIGDLKTYRVSVIISVITTLLGIGALIFAKHPALRSIALLTIIGISSVVFITFTILPMLFNWLVYNKSEKRLRPVTLLDFVFSIMSLIVFMAGSLLLTITMYIIKLIPFVSTKKKKKIFHKALQYTTWFLIYMNVFSKKRVINPQNENFEKPSVIIANHQSHIDLMLIMLTTPKALIVTNGRNIKSKLYGKFIRYADFINVEKNYQDIIEELKERVADGYSIMIFPEGKRSDTGEIKRFHKGAVFIAEQLNLEITPIVFHGVNLLLRKHEFFLKRGPITTKFLPRIDLTKNEFGETTRDRTKGILKYFRAEYQKIKDEYAQTDFHRDYIIKNFLYKGPALEWYTKIKTRLEDNYKYFNDIVPKQAIITDIGCGYGYLSFMLSMISENRSVTGIDYDEDKITVANNCAIKTERVNFIAGDAVEVPFNKSDVFIINDVLHYMLEHKQIKLIEKCFEHLNDGGKIIIRDGNTEKEKRHKGTKLTEFFSIKVLKFNKADYTNLHFISASFVKNIAKKNGYNVEIVDNTKLTSNTVYILTKN